MAGQLSEMLYLQGNAIASESLWCVLMMWTGWSWILAKTVEMSKIQKAWLSKMVGSTPWTLLNSLYMVQCGHSSDTGNKSNTDIYEIMFCLLEKTFSTHLLHFSSWRKWEIKSTLMPLTQHYKVTMDPAVATKRVALFGVLALLCWWLNMDQLWLDMSKWILIH